MKVVVVTNFYGSSAPSGENAVVLNEVSLLRSRGIEVVTFYRDSDELRERAQWGLLKGGLVTPWNPATLKQLKRLLSKERPDVMHVHNTFPLLSPSIFYVSDVFTGPVVMTAHNFRMFCANGLALRNNLPCTLCLDRKSSIPALRYSCYRGSKIATLPLAIMITAHRSLQTWTKQVDVVIALTAFQRDVLLRCGIARSKIVVKPNFYETNITPVAWSSREHKVIFVGRLAAEKGVNILIDAWRLWGGAPVLEIIGDGPERESLENVVITSGLQSKVRFLGRRPFAETQERLSTARLIVVPSLWYEGFPLVIREALACGVPVVASRLGSLEHIVSEDDVGRLFVPSSASDLYHVLRELWNNQTILAAYAEAARQTYLAKYTPERGYTQLMSIYQRAISEKRKGQGRESPQL